MVRRHERRRFGFVLLPAGPLAAGLLASLCVGRRPTSTPRTPRTPSSPCYPSRRRGVFLIFLATLTVAGLKGKRCQMVYTTCLACGKGGGRGRRKLGDNELYASLCVPLYLSFTCPDMCPCICPHMYPYVCP